MSKFDLFRHVRNAAGQPRPIDVAALAGLDVDRAIDFADGLLLVAEDRAQGLPDDQADTATELVKLVTESLEASRVSAGKAQQTTQSRKDAADAVHAALIAVGDLALLLEASGKLHTTDAKQGLDPKAIFAKRRQGAAR